MPISAAYGHVYGLQRLIQKRLVACAKRTNRLGPRYHPSKIDMDRLGGRISRSHRCIVNYNQDRTSCEWHFRFQPKETIRHSGRAHDACSITNMSNNNVTMSCLRPFTSAKMAKICHHSSRTVICGVLLLDITLMSF